MGGGRGEVLNKQPCVCLCECACVCVSQRPENQRRLLEENLKANLWVTRPIWVLTDCVPRGYLTRNTCCFLCRVVGQGRGAARSIQIRTRGWCMNPGRS